MVPFVTEDTSLILTRGMSRPGSECEVEDIYVESSFTSGKRFPLHSWMGINPSHADHL